MTFLPFLEGGTTIAYLGPGGAISSIGAALAAFAAIIVAILGFIWYPIRRIVRKLRKPVDTPEDPPSQ